MAGTSLEQHSASGDDQGHGGVLERPQVGPVVSYNPDAPSEEWGWHGSWREFAPRGSRALLWLGVVGLLLFLFGNQQSMVEDWWLLAIAGLMAAWLIWGEIKIRKDRARRP